MTCIGRGVGGANRWAVVCIASSAQISGRGRAQSSFLAYGKAEAVSMVLLLICGSGHKYPAEGHGALAFEACKNGKREGQEFPPAIKQQATPRACGSYARNSVPSRTSPLRA